MDAMRHRITVRFSAAAASGGLRATGPQAHESDRARRMRCAYWFPCGGARAGSRVGDFDPAAGGGL
jgi:hypothetical protein